MNLALVNNPRYRSIGDFGLDQFSQPNLVIKPQESRPTYTFSGVGLYRRSVFSPLVDNARRPLAPIIHRHITERQVTGFIHPGKWFDIGTAERLAEARLAELD